MESKTPFGARMQGIVIAMMLLSFVFIIQKFSMKLYNVGLLLLIASGISQMAFGNIPSTSSFKESRVKIVVAYGIVACVFGLGIFLAPVLINMGR